MIRFSLSRAREKVAPEQMTLPDGRAVDVNADFRCVLKCLRTLKNPEFTGRQKEALIALYFFKGARVDEPAQMLGRFLDDGEKAGEDDEPVMDFEQDSDVIYASFVQEYGIDLIETPFLHWAKFKALLAGLSADSALGRRIRIREMDTGKLEPKERAKAERLKRRVQLDAAPLTAEEERLQKQLDDALNNGEDPAQAVRALKEYYDRKGGEM